MKRNRRMTMILSCIGEFQFIGKLLSKNGTVRHSKFQNSIFSNKYCHFFAISKPILSKKSVKIAISKPVISIKLSHDFGAIQLVKNRLFGGLAVFGRSKNHHLIFFAISKLPGVKKSVKIAISTKLDEIAAKSRFCSSVR